MSTVKYVTTKGQFGSTPHYIGLVQHDRTMSKKEILSESPRPLCGWYADEPVGPDGRVRAPRGPRLGQPRV